MQGQEMRAIRKAMGLNQGQLAEEVLGMNRKSVNLMETGKAPIERRTAATLRWAEMVGIDGVRDAIREGKL